MFDKAYCDSVMLTESAYVNIESLTALSDFLSIHLSQASPTDVQAAVDEHNKPTNRQSKAAKRITTARAVRIAHRHEPMAPDSGEHPTSSPRTGGSNVNREYNRHTGKGGCQ